jgi:Xaa-Pro dipeptidase
MNTLFQKRRADLARWMAGNNVQAVVFEDTEGRRSPAVRYYTNHPEDAILVINNKAEAVLCPWDENIAKQKAVIETIVPYTKYDRTAIKAVGALLKLLKVPEKSRVEIPSITPYPVFLRYVEAFPQYDILCKEEYTHHFAVEQRQVKDEYEISCARKAAEITNRIIDTIETQIKKGKIKTETDAALLIEKECRAAGCEGTSFATLAAGPSRSFGIHCFPNYTDAQFPADGLSILDFGVNYSGYASDVTLTFAKGELTEEQEKQIQLVEKAYDAALHLYEKGVPLRTPALKVDEIFAKAKRKMPHSLGHGMGLEIHEAPWIRAKTEPEKTFQTGMIASLEPGLYDPVIGGCRLENDILITDQGPEVLTRSRIIRIP